MADRRRSRYVRQDVHRGRRQPADRVRRSDHLRYRGVRGRLNHIADGAFALLRQVGTDNEGLQGKRERQIHDHVPACG